MQIDQLQASPAQIEDNLEAAAIRELTVEEILEVSGGPQVINDGGVH